MVADIGELTVTSANGAKGYANISIFSLPPPVSISYSTDRDSKF